MKQLLRSKLSALGKKKQALESVICSLLGFERPLNEPKIAQFAHQNLSAFYRIFHDRYCQIIANTVLEHSILMICTENYPKSTVLEIWIDCSFLIRVHRRPNKSLKYQHVHYLFKHPVKRDILNNKPSKWLSSPNLY